MYFLRLKWFSVYDEEKKRKGVVYYKKDSKTYSGFGFDSEKDQVVHIDERDIRGNEDDRQVRIFFNKLDRNITYWRSISFHNDGLNYWNFWRNLISKGGTLGGSNFSKINPSQKFSKL